MTETLAAASAASTDASRQPGAAAWPHGCQPLSAGGEEGLVLIVSERFGWRRRGRPDPDPLEVLPELCVPLTGLRRVVCVFEHEEREPAVGGAGGRVSEHLRYEPELFGIDAAGGELGQVAGREHCGGSPTNLAPASRLSRRRRTDWGICRLECRLRMTS
jgi:hypothetical protein